jgi:hypothetical protein
VGPYLEDAAAAGDQELVEFLRDAQALLGGVPHASAHRWEASLALRLAMLCPRQVNCIQHHRKESRDDV